MPRFHKVEINKTEWIVPERYQMLTPVGSGAYGQVWYVFNAKIFGNMPVITRDNSSVYIYIVNFTSAQSEAGNRMQISRYIVLTWAGSFSCLFLNA